MRLNKPNRRRFYIILLAVLLVVFVGAALAYRHMERANYLPAGTRQYSVDSGGLARSYRLHVPESLPANQQVPLVVMMHGALGTSSQAEASYGWNEKALEGQFIVAYPEGIKRSWKVSEDCCGPPASQGIDDAAFIGEMVAQISKDHPIDTKRIYATGISNGGALAYRLACDTDIFAAVGAVATNLLGECASPKPLSVIHIHGKADETFPYTGGLGKHGNDGTGDRPANTQGKPIEEMIARWRSIGACDEPSVSEKGEVLTSTASCAGGRSVSLIAIAGAGHQWPGSVPAKSAAGRLLQLDPPSKALDATDTIWKFFGNQAR